MTDFISHNTQTTLLKIHAVLHSEACGAQMETHRSVVRVSACAVNTAFASFTSMPGCFGLRDDPNGYHLPPDRLVEARPCVDVFKLYRQGALVQGASATLQWGHRGTLLAAREGGIWIDGQPVAVRSHALGMPVFVCSSCNHDCYRLYEHSGVWACRRCHGLDYACRHRHCSIPGYSRILYLRRRLGAELRPFAPLPDVPRSHTRKRGLAADIRSLEARLVGHLGGVNHDLGRRIRSRKAKFR